jgi:hypothetical protein
MKRREFLKKVGIGSAVLVFLLILANTLSTPAWAGVEQTNVRVYRFVAFSHAARAEDGAIPRMGLTGSGTFSPERGEVQGGGNYFRDNAAAPVPRPLLDFGTWVPTEIVSFDLVPDGTFGRVTAGILVLRIRFFSDVDESVSTGTLRLICNIGDADIMTGEPEGFRLTIDDTEFGEFRPLTPAVGLTHLGLLATP